MTCPFCSLLCADVQPALDQGRLAGFAPECAIAQSGYARAVEEACGETHPASRLEVDLAAAHAWLGEARQPLVVLSGGVDCASVSAAITLARRFSAVLTCDEPASGALLGEAMRSAGLLSATLGELKSLELIVLCGVDPVCSHPRLDDFLPMDWRKNAVILDPPDPLEAVRWLRLARAGETAGQPVETARAAKQIAAAQSGLVIFGPKWLERGQPFAMEYLRWLSDLSQAGRWYALYLAPAPNSIGVVETLLSEIGYPGCLHLSSHGLDYSPHLWQGGELIENGAVDLCLLVGHPGAFSGRTLARLSDRRVILVSPRRPDWDSVLWLPCAQAGVDAPGLFLRLDGLPAPLRPILPSQRPEMSTILLTLAGGEQ